MLDLKIYPDDALRAICGPVQDFDRELHMLLDKMQESMDAENGIGLAANQVGHRKRIFIANVTPMFDEDYIKEFGAPTEWDQKKIEFVNPKIVHREGKIQWNEGCLSFPTLYFDITRAAEIVIEAQDRFGKHFSVKAKNVLAVCCQHEYDHLDGKVFIDYISQSKRTSAMTKLKKIKTERQSGG